MKNIPFFVKVTGMVNWVASILEQTEYTILLWVILKELRNCSGQVHLITWVKLEWLSLLTRKALGRVLVKGITLLLQTNCLRVCQSWLARRKLGAGPLWARKADAADCGKPVADS